MCHTFKFVTYHIIWIVHILVHVFDVSEPRVFNLMFLPGEEYGTRYGRSYAMDNL